MAQSAIHVFDQSRADIHDNHLSDFAIGLIHSGQATARVWANTITNNYNSGVDYLIWTEVSEEYPDFGGGYQGSPGENVIKGNGSLTGYDFRIEGKGTSSSPASTSGDTKDVLVARAVY